MSSANSRKAAQQLEAALCPPVGDGSLLQPELFHMELQGALTALRRMPAVWLCDELGACCWRTLNCSGPIPA